jgi:hypothetical protein
MLRIYDPDVTTIKCPKIRNLMPAQFTGLPFVKSSSPLIKDAGDWTSTEAKPYISGMAAAIIFRKGPLSM